jgi:hypothetical protein
MQHLFIPNFFPQKEQRLRCPTYDDSNNKEKGYDDLFILEDSPKVTDNEWINFMNCVESAVTASTKPDSRFGILILAANNNNPVFTIGLSIDREAVMTSLIQYKRKSAFLPLSKGLEAINNMALRPDLSRRVFLFLKTPPDNNAKKISQELRMNMKLDIIGIPNGVERSEIEPLCSLGKVHKIEEWSKVLEYFEASDALKRRIRDYHVELQVYAKNIPIGFGNDLHLKIVFLNRGEKEIPPGIEFLITENEYFYRTPIYLDGESDSIGINENDRKTIEVIVQSKRKKKSSTITVGS